LWTKVTEAFSNPESLKREINKYITKLEERRVELESKIKPIDVQLNNLRQKKAKLADNWVRNALGKEAFTDMVSELDTQEANLNSIRADIDPAQIEELKVTAGWLDFWRKEGRELDLRLSFIFEGTSDESELRKNQSQKVAETILNIADLDMPEFTEIGSPTSKRKLLDYLQVSLIAYPDRVEIKAVLPMNNIDIQQYQPTYTSGRCP
jgi:site-specific DNA recombinase